MHLIPLCAGTGNLKVELQQRKAIGAELEFTLQRVFGARGFNCTTDTINPVGVSPAYLNYLTLEKQETGFPPCTAAPK